MYLLFALSYKMNRASFPSYPADVLTQAFDTQVVTNARENHTTTKERDMASGSQSMCSGEGK